MILRKEVKPTVLKIGNTVVQAQEIRTRYVGTLDIPWSDENANWTPDQIDRYLKVQEMKRRFKASGRAPWLSKFGHEYFARHQRFTVRRHPPKIDPVFKFSGLEC